MRLAYALFLCVSVLVLGSAACAAGPTNLETLAVGTSAESLPVIPAAVTTAQSAVLTFLRTSAIECVPPAGAAWRSALLVVPSGFQAYEFKSDGCTMVVTAAAVDPTAYHVSLRNPDLGFCWQAIVDDGGQVVRTGLAAETEPGPGNAAANYCAAQGYTYTILQTAPDSNKCGYCIFPDGSQCKSWLFFYGECAPGDNPTATTP